MSWGQYLLLQRGYWQKHNRQWEERRWNTRELYWILYNSNVAENKQRTREELMPLPSDKEQIPTDPKAKLEMMAKQNDAFFDALDAFCA